MELDELKSAWSRISSENEKLQLNENDIHKLVKNRTLDISEKIGRNIRVGVGIIIAWVCLWFIINFIITPFFDKYLDKPYLTDGLMFGALLGEALIYVLILATIFIFWIRYSKIEKVKLNFMNLREKLQQLIKILESYRIMFYIVLFIIIIYATLAFSSGFFMEYNYQIQQSAIDISKFKFMRWVVVVFAFLFVLGIIIAIYYLLFNFFFKRLYGRYLKQLKATLKELDESYS
jgi:hypothetical protein